MYAACLVSMGLIGTLVLINNPRHAVNRYFFAFTLGIILWMTSLFTGYFFIHGDLEKSLFFFRFAFGAGLLGLHFLLLFLYFFPKKTFPVPRFTGTVLTVVAFAVSIVATFSPAVEKDLYMKGSTPIDVFGPFYEVFLVMVVGYFLFILGFVVKKYFQSNNIDRKKVLYVGIGLILSLLFPISTNLVLPIFGIFIMQNEAAVFFLFFFVAVFYSIYKQRFFNLSYVILGILRNLILFLFFLLAFVTSFYLLIFVMGEGSRLAVLTMSSVIGFLLLRTLNRVFPDLYGMKFSQLKKTLAEFEAKIFNAKTFDEIYDLLQSTFVEKLNLKNASIRLLGKEGLNSNIPVYVEDDFTAILAKTSDIVVADELRSAQTHDNESRTLLNKLHDLKAALCFPLFSQGKMIGFLALGAKPKKEIFSREEIEELLKIRSSIEVCFMNIVISGSLREENDLMKIIINERTDTLKKANEKLEKMLKEQDSFISLTAHEFRTPLTVAKLGLEQLSFVHKKRLPADVIEDVKTSQIQLDKLAFLINRLLEMRRLEDDRIPVTIEKFELVSFVAESIKNMNLIGAKDGITFEFIRPRAKSVDLSSDRVKLQQVMDNLLQNACKFTRKGGNVTVELKIPAVKAAKKPAKVAMIAVKDEGPGIPKKDLDIIFDKFQQGSRYSQGVGLGLYLCRLYMRLLGGSISVQSQVGKGAVFTVKLPLMKRT